SPGTCGPSMVAGPSPRPTSIRRWRSAAEEPSRAQPATGPGSQAAGAVTGDGQVLGVGHEVVLLGQPSGDGRERRRRELDHPATDRADGVVVLVDSEVVADRSRTQTGLAEQAELLERLQGAIHGGEVHLGRAAVDA